VVDIVNEKPDYRSEIMKQLNTKISKNVSGAVFKPILRSKLDKLEKDSSELIDLAFNCEFIADVSDTAE